MVSWNDYKTAARERGSLAYELFVAISSPTSDPEAVKSQLPAHLSYQAALEAAGQLAFAGPLSDPTGEQMQGVGMIVYRADTLEAARAMADADPMHSSGAREYIMRRWMINEGSLQLDIKLSAQQVRLEP